MRRNRLYGRPVKLCLSTGRALGPKFNYAWLSSPETNLSSYMVSEIRFGTSVTRIGYADNDCGGALKKAPQEALNQTDSHLQIEYAHLHSLKTKIKKDNAFIAEYTFNRSGMLLLEEDAFGARKVSTAETLDMLYLDDYKQMREVNLSRISQAVVHPEAVNYVEEAVAAGPTSYKGRINPRQLFRNRTRDLFLCVFL